SDRGVSRGALERGDRDQPLRGIPCNESRDPGDEAEGVGAHYQHRVRARAGGERAEAAYVAAKHGVVGLTKVAALELADSGITANAICPGWVLTPLVERQLEE